MRIQRLKFKIQNNNIQPRRLLIDPYAPYSGFTLMELMIVIALIAILAMAGTGSYLASLKKGRDTERKSDVNQIQKAFELYLQDQAAASYPAVLPSCGAVWTPYMSKFPCNNQTSNKQYIYVRDNTDFTVYTLTACLENASDPEADVIKNDGCAVASYTITQP